ncbi:MAG: NAD-dependent epimerase/dehydratase family protein [Candidatus Hydrogenedentes bacterium]|nr:NAD-dependent epimerase/dehydratase family protein [Candidatus Hydrogenedentota bacterium]
MNVLVTGANGFIGANLVRMLLEQGDTVKALTHGSTRSLKGLGIEMAECPLLDKTALCKAVKGSDLVFHLASMITLLSKSNPVAENINETGARNVAEACLECGVKRLVHFSSIHAFSPEPKEGIVVESRPLCDRTHPFPYDRSKAAGQRAVLQVARQGLDVVIIHPTGVMGPYDFGPSHAGKGLLDLYHGSTRVLVAGGFNWVDVRDVCTGALSAAQKGRTQENYILSGSPIPLKEMGELVSKLTGCRPPLMIAPLWLAKMGAQWIELQAKLKNKEPRFSKFTLHTLEHHQKVSHQKATRELGYQPRNFLDTLKNTLEWFSQAGMLHPPVTFSSKK